MARRNPNLKTYVRVTPNGDIVPSTGVLRKQKPKIGRWMEIEANTCCSGISLVADISGVSIPSTNAPIQVTVICDGDVLTQVNSTGSIPSIEGLVDTLNSGGTQILGTFTTDGSSVTLNLVSEIANLCDGELELEIASF